jgi:hypothetical protein
MSQLKVQVGEERFLVTVLLDSCVLKQARFCYNWKYILLVIRLH